VLPYLLRAAVHVACKHVACKTGGLPLLFRPPDFTHKPTGILGPRGYANPGKLLEILYGRNRRRFLKNAKKRRKKLKSHEAATAAEKKSFIVHGKAVAKIYSHQDFDVTRHAQEGGCFGWLEELCNALCSLGYWHSRKSHYS